MSRLFVTFMLLAALLPPAGAQEHHETAVRRALLERDQQSAAFVLQLEQSQERARMNPGSPEAIELEALQQAERRRAEAVDQEHLSSLTASAPGPVQAGERARFERERGAAALRTGSALRAGRNALPKTPGWTPTLEPAPRAWTPTLEVPEVP